VKKRSVLLISLFVLGCAHAPCQKDAIFQNAPINSLLAGSYTGTMSVHDLKKQGDFGLGTLNALDGELAALDGAFYQIKPDGKVIRLSDNATSPFATVTFFKADRDLASVGEISFKDLTVFLNAKLGSPNLFYAIKVEGKFKTLKVRSAARQEKPYQVLTEAIKQQKVFELKDQEGTLVGFRCPPYAGGVNVPGYHFHFLSKDKTVGGHVLDLQAEDLRIQADEIRGFSMQLPTNDEFLKFRFEADPEKALAKIEK